MTHRTIAARLLLLPLAMLCGRSIPGADEIRRQPVILQGDQALAAIVRQERRTVANGQEQLRVVSRLVPLESISVDDFSAWMCDGMSREQLRESSGKFVRERLQQLEHVATLTYDDRERLQLAAAGDLERFLAQCNEARGQLLKAVGQNADLRPPLERCRTVHSRGGRDLHGDGSLFEKTLQCVLSKEQHQQVRERFPQPRPVRRFQLYIREANAWRSFAF